MGLGFMVDLLEKIDYAKLHEAVEQTVKPKGAPVGVKLFEDVGQFEKLHLKPPERQLALCQVLKYSSVYERTFGVQGKDIDACVVGTYVLGFLQPPSDLKKRWVEGFKYTDKKFEALVKGTHALPVEKYKALLVSTLKFFSYAKTDPDMVFIPVNSTQAYLLLVGYFDATGEKPTSDFCGHAACEIIAAVMNKKKPWTTIPCGGARAIAEAQDDEIWISMLPTQLNMTIGRLKDVGLKYPPPIYQMLQMTPDPAHTLTGLIKR
jgi:uncharacterized protein (DUF169 family)